MKRTIVKLISFGCLASVSALGERHAVEPFEPEAAKPGTVLTQPAGATPPDKVTEITGETFSAAPFKNPNKSKTQILHFEKLKVTLNSDPKSPKKAEVSFKIVGPAGTGTWEEESFILTKMEIRETRGSNPGQKEFFGYIEGEIANSGMLRIMLDSDGKKIQTITFTPPYINKKTPFGKFPVPIVVAGDKFDPKI